MKNFLFLVPVFFFSFHSFLNGQSKNSDSLQASNNHKFFGNIYTGFYYGLNDNISPRQSFELTTALLGYKVDLSEKVKATLIYDVTKTTGDIQVKDTSNSTMNVSYFKGSDYTAFLKQAQLDWNFSGNIELSIGQLLNQQYLTFQDKFWGYRYISYTFQERYKFGSPADFGARLTWRKKDVMNISIGAVNGDGAFYRQDTKGLMLYHVNLEIFPVKNLALKFYFDISPDNSKPARMVYSSFIGYKNEKWWFGAEYCYLMHPDFISEKYYNGYSFYGSYNFTNEISVLARYDIIENSVFYTNSQYFIGGIQYQPIKHFLISVNGRKLLPQNELQVYLNFGAKF